MSVGFLRRTKRDLDNWRRSPLRPLIDRLNITKSDLEQAANKVNEATEEILKIEAKTQEMDVNDKNDKL